MKRFRSRVLKHNSGRRSPPIKTQSHCAEGVNNTQFKANGEIQTFNTLFFSFLSGTTEEKKKEEEEEKEKEEEKGMKKEKGRGQLNTYMYAQYYYYTHRLHLLLLPSSPPTP